MNMKIKKLLTIALVAAAALTACEKNVNPGGNESGNGNENGNGNEGGDENGDNPGGDVETVQYTDVLTWDIFADVEGREHTYFDFSDLKASMSDAVVSDAVYAGNVKTYQSTSIQMRSKSGDSGIVTTKSGGKILKLSFVWNPGTEAGGLERKVELWGKNTAYNSATDLYEESGKGELLGTNIFDPDNLQSEITVTGDCQFIGIRSADGAIYFDRIEITWETTK